VPASCETVQRSKADKHERCYPGGWLGVGRSIARTHHAPTAKRHLDSSSTGTFAIEGGVGAGAFVHLAPLSLGQRLRSPAVVAGLLFDLREVGLLEQRLRPGRVTVEAGG
jgi:hypothetical protein